MPTTIWSERSEIAKTAWIAASAMPATTPMTTPPTHEPVLSAP